MNGKNENKDEIDVFQERSSSKSDVKIDSFSLPLGSRTLGTSVPVSNSNTKMENLKSWSINTYKCTKQVIQEKLGKVTKTVDVDLEIRIEKLKEVQMKYNTMLISATKIVNNFTSLIENQKILAEQFSELGQQQPELVSEFETNANLQRILQKQGEQLIHILKFFCDSLETLTSKTMNDTLVTIKNYENARIEYDAYRIELEMMNKSKSNDPIVVTKLMELKEKVQEKQKSYDKFRSDVDVKLKFLEENKNRVMHKQLVMFNNAITAYFTGNKTELESTIKQFNLSLKNSNNSQISWLENVTSRKHSS